MKTIEMFDLFGKSPSFIVRSKTEHKTSFGGIVAILMMIVTLVAAIFFGQEIINKKSPSVNLSTESYLHPEKLPYEDNFEFILGVQNIDKNCEINPRIYFVKGFLFSTIVNSTGTFNSRRDVDMVPCSQETLSQENYNALKQYDLETYYCISKKQAFSSDELFINEFFDQNTFQMIQVKLYECRNTTQISNCESKEVIENFLNLTTMNYIIIDNYVQTMNYKKPFTKGIKSSFFWISQNFYLSLTQYIHHIKMHSDDGLLFSTDKIKGGFKLEEMISYSIYQRDSDSFVSLSIQLNNLLDGYYRKYYKLQDFAAQIGGIYKVICMVLFLAMMLYEETSYYQFLINSFFSINENNKRTDDNLFECLPTTKNTKVLKKELSLKNNSIIQTSQHSNLILNSKYNKTSKKTIIKLSFCDRLFCISILPSSWRKKKKKLDDLYFKGRKKLNDNLEIIHIIKSIYDINMLKKYILSEEQLIQYENSIIPILSSNDVKKQFGVLKLKGHLLNNFIKPFNGIYTKRNTEAKLPNKSTEFN